MHAPTMSFGVVLAVTAHDTSVLRREQFSSAVLFGTLKDAMPIMAGLFCMAWTAAFSRLTPTHLSGYHLAARLPGIQIQAVGKYSTVRWNWSA